MLKVAPHPRIDGTAAYNMKDGLAVKLLTPRHCYEAVKNPQCGSSLRLELRLIVLCVFSAAPVFISLMSYNSSSAFPITLNENTNAELKYCRILLS